VQKLRPHLVKGIEVVLWHSEAAPQTRHKTTSDQFIHYALGDKAKPMSLHLSKASSPWLLGLSLAVILTGGIGFYSLSRFGARSPAPTAAAPSPRQIGALGRLEPEAEVVKLSAPLALDGDRLAQLWVKEGETIEAGQVVAVMDAQTRLADTLKQAQQQVKVAEAKLAQLEAGAKTGEIAAQQAAIARLQAELMGEQAAQAAEVSRWQAEMRKAEAEWNRFQQLFSQGAVAASTLDDKRLTLETTQAQLQQAKAQQAQALSSTKAQIQQAKATLNQISEVRPVDIQAAQMEVNEARAAVQRAQTELAQAEIRAPITAQVLKIHTRPGEKLGDAGIVDLAQTHQMLAIAEVYQSDINQVKVGQAATVTGSAFAGQLQGTVSEIGLQVTRQNVFSNQPGENLDQRVVEVKIRLSSTDSQKVARLTNLQIQTTILIDSPNQGSINQPSVNQPSEQSALSSAQANQPQNHSRGSICSGLLITNVRFKLRQLC
jgi:HlyD family secretion protein